jgi:hypothetical protein
VLQRGPLHHHHPMRIGNFVSFSHFWSWRDGISPAEMRLLKVCRDALPSDRRWIAADVGAHLGHFAFYGGALVLAVTLSQLVRGREERL